MYVYVLLVLNSLRCVDAYFLIDQTQHPPAFSWRVAEVCAAAVHFKYQGQMSFVCFAHKHHVHLTTMHSTVQQEWHTQLALELLPQTKLTAAALLCKKENYLADVAADHVADELLGVCIDGAPLSHSSYNGAEVVISEHHICTMTAKDGGNGTTR